MTHAEGTGTSLLWNLRTTMDVRHPRPRPTPRLSSARYQSTTHTVFSDDSAINHKGFQQPLNCRRESTQDASNYSDAISRTVLDPGVSSGFYHWVEGVSISLITIAPPPTGIAPQSLSATKIGLL